MVKVGFICEGHTEKIIIDSENFENILKENEIEKGKVINAKGKDNIPEEIRNYNSNSDYLFIIIDLDNDNCPLDTIEKRTKKIKGYKNPKNHIFIIAIKEIESWFLADKAAMKEIEITFNQNPEELNEPYERIKSLLNKNKKRKLPIGKVVMAKKFIDAGFSIENAAKNIYCTSAEYFMKKIKQTKR